MDKQTLNIIEEEASKLLELLEIEGKVSVSEEDSVAHVNIDTTDTGILIGYHGETLYSFQLILGLICYAKLGQWIRVVVNVGDYRQKRAGYLQQLAVSKAEMARSSGRPQTITGLSPFERRVVHVVVSEFSDLVSQSTGEGDERVLTIRPK